MTEADLNEKDKQKRKSWKVEGLKEDHVKVEVCPFSQRSGYDCGALSLQLGQLAGLLLLTCGGVGKLEEERGV